MPAVKVAEDQSKLADFQNSDFISAENRKVEFNNPTLEFTHRTARVLSLIHIWYSYAAAFGKLFGTFLLLCPIQKCGFYHIDEHVHILPLLFSVQFGIDNVA